jgi:hypothetical protein
MAWCAGVGRRDAEPAARLPGRHRRAAKGDEHVLGDVFGVVAGAEHPGGDTDDQPVVAPENGVQVDAHGTAA